MKRPGPVTEESSPKRPKSSPKGNEPIEPQSLVDSESHGDTEQGSSYQSQEHEKEDEAIKKAKEHLEAIESMNEFIIGKKKKPSKNSLNIQSNTQGATDSLKLRQSVDNEVIRFMLVGKPGNGKTNFVATLFKVKNLFPELASPNGVTKIPYSVRSGSLTSIERVYCTVDEYVTSCNILEISEHDQTAVREKCSLFGEKEDIPINGDNQVITNLLSGKNERGETMALHERLVTLYYDITVATEVNIDGNIKIFDTIGDEDENDKTRSLSDKLNGTEFNRRILLRKNFIDWVVPVKLSDRGAFDVDTVRLLHKLGTFHDHEASHIPPRLLPLWNTTNHKFDGRMAEGVRKSQWSLQSSIEKYFKKNFSQSSEDVELVLDDTSGTDSLDKNVNIETLFQLYRTVTGYTFALNWNQLATNETLFDPRSIPEYYNVIQKKPVLNLHLDNKKTCQDRYHFDLRFDFETGSISLVFRPEDETNSVREIDANKVIRVDKEKNDNWKFPFKGKKENSFSIVFEGEDGNETQLDVSVPEKKLEDENDVLMLLGSITHVGQKYYYDVYDHIQYLAKIRLEEKKNYYEMLFWSNIRKATSALKLCFDSLSQIGKHDSSAFIKAIPERPEKNGDLSALVQNIIDDNTSLKGSDVSKVRKGILDSIDLRTDEFMRGYVSDFLQTIVANLQGSTTNKNIFSCLENAITELEKNDELSLQRDTRVSQSLKKNSSSNNNITIIAQSIKKGTKFAGNVFDLFLNDITTLVNQTIEEMKNTYTGVYQKADEIWKQKVEFSSWRKVLDTVAEEAAKSNKTFRSMFKCNLAHRVELQIYREPKNDSSKNALTEPENTYNDVTFQITVNSNDSPQEIYTNIHYDKEKTEEKVSVKFLSTGKSELDEKLKNCRSADPATNLAPIFILTKLKGRGKNIKSGTSFRRNEVRDVINYHLSDENYVGCDPNDAKNILLFIAVEPLELKKVKSIIQERLKVITESREEEIKKGRSKDDIPHIDPKNIYYLIHPYDELKIGRARQTVLLFAHHVHRLPRFHMLDDDITWFEEYFQFRFQRNPMIESNLFRSLKFQQRVLDYELNRGIDSKLLEWKQKQNSLRRPLMLGELAKMEEALDRANEDADDEEISCNGEMLNQVYAVVDCVIQGKPVRSDQIIRMYENLETLYSIIASPQNLKCISESLDKYKESSKKIAQSILQVSLGNHSINSMTQIEQKCDKLPYESHFESTMRHACVLFNGDAIGNLYYVDAESYAGHKETTIGNRVESSKIVMKKQVIESVSVKEYYKKYIEIRKNPELDASAMRGKLEDHFGGYGIELSLCDKKKRGRSDLDQEIQKKLKAAVQSDGYDNEDRFLIQLGIDHGRTGFVCFRHAFKCSFRAVNNSNFK